MRAIIILLVGLLTQSIFATGISQYSWWFDSSPESVNTVESSSTTLQLQLDAGSLTPGVHSIYFMCKDENGLLSGVESKPFERVLSPNDILTGSAHLFIDGVFRQTIRDIFPDGRYITDLDLNDCEEGLHTINVMVEAMPGIISSVLENVFFRVPSSDEIQDLSCYYTIDYATQTAHKGRVADNILCADLDVESLADGLHNITFMLMNSHGQTTQSYSSYFLKMPLGGVNISGYSYWINDEIENNVNVDLKDTSNSYILTALLPLEKQPFRSSSFHFDVENGSPVIYTQNDFNIIFNDNRNYFTIKSYPYYDTSSRKVIKEEFKEFDKEKVTVDKIPANEISWFKFEAQKGESISFRLDTSCAFDIFGPDGSKLSSATADKSQQAVDAHISQTGTHYIAIHDQLGGRDKFNAYLSKIDKFALLECSPCRFASDCLIIFDIDGNGLDKLKSVELQGVDGDSIIVANQFANADWGFGQAAFDLTGRNLPKGNYNLIIRCEDEENQSEVVLSKEVEIIDSEIKEVEVEVNPHNTSVADVREIDVVITNPSTVGLWGVPFCVARTSQNPDMGFNFNMYAAEGTEYFKDPIYYDTDNLLGMGVSGRYISMVIPYLGPNETRTYTFTIPRKIKNNFDFYAWCGEPWSLEAVDGDEQPAMRIARAYTQAQADANYQRLSNLQGTLNTGGGVSPRPVSSAASAANLHIAVGCSMGGIIGGADAWRQEGYREAYPTYDTDVAEYMPRIKIPAAMTPLGILNNSGLVPVNIPEGDSPYPRAADGCARAAECGNPRPKKTNVQFPSSHDPNDLLGYVSESGSHYIGKSLKTLDYTIEFENDKEVATASALSVGIENKLDGKVFDLKSFCPKEINIGKKSYTFKDFSNSLVATVDMRPEINGIAQINLDYNDATGELTLLIQTLNPYTMEVSEDMSQGILPVNYNGLGLGEFSYEIDLKNGISHKTVISNQAEIVFDSNDPILTPVWDNITDYISPVSEILSWDSEDGYVYSFELNGSDEDSGLWRFDLYMRSAEDSEWTLVKEGIEDSCYVHTFKEKLDNPEFLSVAIDYAGNYEDTVVNSKFMGDVDSNGRVDSNDLVLLYRYYVGQPVTINLNVADVNNDGKIDSQDAVAVQRIYLQQALSKSVKRKLNNFRNE